MIKTYVKWAWKLRLLQCMLKLTQLQDLLVKLTFLAIKLMDNHSFIGLVTYLNLNSNTTSILTRN